MHFTPVIFVIVTPVTRAPSLHPPKEARAAQKAAPLGLLKLKLPEDCGGAPRRRGYTRSGSRWHRGLQGAMSP